MVRVDERGRAVRVGGRWVAEGGEGQVGRGRSGVEPLRTLKGQPGLVERLCLL